MIVYFEETGEQREVVRRCRVCSPDDDGLGDVEIVSPTGIAHESGGGYGVTDCGHDATGDKWWWRL